MSRSFGLVDSKVQEAEYFLNRILHAPNFFFGVQCDTVAFTASARSITFALQASLTGISEFDIWYPKKQAELREDSLAKFFHDFRRISQHVGDNVVVGGSGTTEKPLFHFGPIPDLRIVPDLDVASACQTYFTLILNLVYECYIRFNPIINGQWRYTREHFESIGKTIEDAERELLGLPPGWCTDSELTEEHRWVGLRRNADGCNIQRQFERWLGKRVPHPDDEK